VGFAITSRWDRTHRASSQGYRILTTISQQRLRKPPSSNITL
jgi:hypothetical protein